MSKLVYLRNLGKSFSYVVKEDVSNALYEPLEASYKAKDAYTNMRDNMRNNNIKGSFMQRLMGQSKTFRELKNFTKTLLGGFKTGKLYVDQATKYERETSSYDDMFYDDNTETGDAKEDVSEKRELPGPQMSDISAEATVRGTEVREQGDQTRHVDSIMHSTQLNTSLIQSIMPLNDSLSKIMNFHETSTKSFYESSAKYYTDSANILNEIKATLKTAFPIEEKKQDNYYGGEESFAKLLANKDFKKAFGVGQKSLITKFAEMSWITNAALSIFNMADSTGMLEQIKNDPSTLMKFGLEGIIDKFTGYKDTLKRAEDVFKDKEYKINSYLGALSLSDDVIKRGIGDALRDKGGYLENVDLLGSKGDVNRNIRQWNFEAQHALTHVIPTYLSQLVALAEKAPRKVYDYKNLQFTNATEVLDELRKNDPRNEIEKKGTNLFEKVLDYTKTNDMRDMMIPNEMTPDRIKSATIQIYKALIDNNQNLQAFVGGDVKTIKNKLQLQNMEDYEIAIFKNIFGTLRSKDRERFESMDKELEKVKDDISTYNKKFRDDYTRRNFHSLNDRFETIEEKDAYGKTRKRTQLELLTNELHDKYYREPENFREFGMNGIFNDNLTDEEKKNILKRSSKLKQATYIDSILKEFASEGVFEKFSKKLSEEKQEKIKAWLNDNPYSISKAIKGDTSDLDLDIKNLFGYEEKEDSVFKKIKEKLVSKYEGIIKSSAQSEKAHKRYEELNKEGKSMADIVATLQAEGHITETEGKNIMDATAMTGRVKNWVKDHKKSLLVGGGILGGIGLIKYLNIIPAFKKFAGGLLRMTPLIGPVLPALGLLAPIGVAGLLLGGGILAYKKLTDSAMGDEEGKLDTAKGKVKKFFSGERMEKFKKYAVNTMFSAGGMAAGGLLLKSLGGLPVVGKLFGMASGTFGLLGPIGLAGVAIGSAMLLELPSIKAKLFGEDNKDKSFYTNIKEWLFGDKEKGTGGVLSKYKTKIVSWFETKSGKVSDWFSKHVSKPFTDALVPAKELMKDAWNKMTKKVGDSVGSVSDKITGILSEKVVTPFTTWLEEKFFKPIGGFVEKMTNTLGNLLGKIISAPFKFFKDLVVNMNEKRKEAEEKKKMMEKGREERDEKIKAGWAKVKNFFGYGNKGIAGKELPFDIKRALFYGRENNSLFGRGMSFEDSANLYDKYSYGNIKKGIKNIISKVKNDFKSTVGFGDAREPLDVAGCAIFAASKALSKATNDEIKVEDLKKIADYYKERGEGIGFGFFYQAAKMMGINAVIVSPKESGFNKNEFIKLIKAGNTAVLNVETEVGSLHYVALLGIDTSGLTRRCKVYDSNTDREESWALSRVMGAREIVIFYKNKEKLVNGIPKPEEESFGRSLIKSIKSVLRNNRNERIENRIRENSDMLNDDINELSKENEEGNEGEINEVSVKGSSLDKKFLELFSKSNKIVDDRLIKINNTLEDGFADLKDVIELSMNGVSYNAEYIKRVLAKAHGPLEGADEIEAGFFSKIFAGRKGFFSRQWTKLKMGGRYVRRKLGGIQDFAFGLVRDTFEWITEKFKDSLVFKTLKGIWELGGKLKDMFKSFIGGFGTLIGFILDPTKWIPVFEGLYVVGKDLISGIGKGILAIFKDAVLPGIKTLVIEPISAVLGGIKTLTESLANIAVGIVELAGTALWETTKFAGKAIWNTGAFLLNKTFNLGMKTFDWFRDKKKVATEVVIKGGYLDKVSEIDKVALIGAIDEKAFRNHNRRNQSKRNKKKKQIDPNNDMINDVNTNEIDETSVDVNDVGEKGAFSKTKEILGDLRTHGLEGKKAFWSLVKNVGGLFGAASILSALYGGVKGGKEEGIGGIVPGALKGAFKPGEFLKGVVGETTGFMGKVLGDSELAKTDAYNYEGEWAVTKILRMKVGEKIATGSFARGAVTATDNVMRGLPKAGLSLAQAITNQVFKVFSSKAVRKFMPNVALTICAKSAVIGKTLGAKIAAKAGQGLSRELGAIPIYGLVISAGFVLWDLYSGWDNAYRIFGVDKDVVTFQMCHASAAAHGTQSIIAALLRQFLPGAGNVLSIMLACVPMGWLARWLYELIYGDIDAARDKAMNDKKRQFIESARKAHENQYGKDNKENPFDESKLLAEYDKISLLKGDLSEVKSTHDDMFITKTNKGNIRENNLIRAVNIAKGAILQNVGYLDKVTDGYIGYGSIAKPGETTITKEEALRRLHYDLWERMKMFSSSKGAELWNKLSPEMKAAALAEPYLMDSDFNEGGKNSFLGVLKGKRTLNDYMNYIRDRKAGLYANKDKPYADTEWINKSINGFNTMEKLLTGNTKTGDEYRLGAINLLDESLGKSAKLHNLKLDGGRVDGLTEVANDSLTKDTDLTKYLMDFSQNIRTKDSEKSTNKMVDAIKEIKLTIPEEKKDVTKNTTVTNSGNNIITNNHREDIMFKDSLERALEGY